MCTIGQLCSVVRPLRLPLLKQLPSAPAPHHQHLASLCPTSALPTPAHFWPGTPETHALCAAVLPFVSLMLCSPESLMHAE